MSDDGNGGMDPCACIWSQDLVMQRLLSFLRQSQDYCSDTECWSLSRLPGPAVDSDNSESNDFFMLCFFTIIGLLLYAFRPQSARKLDKEFANRNSDFDGEPPVPPPSVN
ncbi:small integral membrane protein 14 isoform X2 [Trichogramma pretiosum]|uniref:Small integral membrane protein 14 n=2 Tax=Trichogramma TaxID=7490 RepID=A0ABD2XK87_9HYME|nr:small integral membrane protein 14 isoform X2 [Trichogramma pretiosum]